MTINETRRIMKSERFESFTLHLADGRRFKITHPESVAFSSGGRTVAIALPDDSFEIVDLLLVTSLNRPPARRRNGRQ